MQEIALIIIGVLVLSMIITIWNWCKTGDYPVSFELKMRDPMFRNIMESRQAASKLMWHETLTDDEYAARRAVLLKQVLSGLPSDYLNGYKKTL